MKSMTFFMSIFFAFSVYINSAMARNEYEPAAKPASKGKRNPASRPSVAKRKKKKIVEENVLDFTKAPAKTENEGNRQIGSLPEPDFDHTNSN